MGSVTSIFDPVRFLFPIAPPSPTAPLSLPNSQIQKLDFYDNLMIASKPSSTTAFLPSPFLKQILNFLCILEFTNFTLFQRPDPWVWCTLKSAKVGQVLIEVEIVNNGILPLLFFNWCDAQWHMESSKISYELVDTVRGSCPALDWFVQEISSNFSSVHLILFASFAHPSSRLQVSSPAQLAIGSFPIALLLVRMNTAVTRRFSLVAPFLSPKAGTWSLERSTASPTSSPTCPIKRSPGAQTSSSSP